MLPKKSEIACTLNYNIPSSFVDSHNPYVLHKGLSCNDQWYSLIENNIDSAANILRIMRKLKYYASRNALNQMYMSYMLSFVEYASVLWDWMF